MLVGLLRYDHNLTISMVSLFDNVDALMVAVVVVVVVVVDCGGFPLRAARREVGPTILLYTLFLILSSSSLPSRYIDPQKGPNVASSQWYT